MLGALLQQRGDCWIFGVSLWKSNNTIEPRINSLRVVAIDQQLKQYSGYFQGSVFPTSGNEAKYPCQTRLAWLAVSWLRRRQIGRASCRERVAMSVGERSLSRL